MISKFIKTACIVGSIAFLFQAGLSLFYGPAGNGHFVVAGVLVGSAFLLFSFLRRRPWSWLLVLIFTLAQVIETILLPPTEYFYGASIDFARALVILAALACAILFTLMLVPSTKS